MGVESINNPHIQSEKSKRYRPRGSGEGVVLSFAVFVRRLGAQHRPANSQAGNRS